MPSKTSTEIYAEVQSRFEKALNEAIHNGGGLAPWTKPWVGGADAPRNLFSGKRYRGINVLLLGMAGYSDPRWTTANAARKHSGSYPRKGERSTLVTLWKRLKVADKDNPGETKVIPMLRYFLVFNVEQIDWKKDPPKLPEPETAGDWDRHAEADGVLAEYLDSPNAPQLSTRDAEGAAYSQSEHILYMPAQDRFKSAEGFYGALFHECGHSTGHKSMLARDLSGRFGSGKYGYEELVAEMSSAFVCASIGIDGGFDQSVAYLRSWLKAIQDDEKMLIRAAGMAQKAADRILGISFAEPESPVEPSKLDSTVAVA